MISAQTRIAGVIGHPIGHSLSPVLMNHWIEATGLDAAYIALPAQADLDAAAIRDLAKTGFAGLNVTLPFKPLALKAADSASNVARSVGAANLLLFREGSIIADNTDVAGARDALAAAGSGFEGRTVLVLGAGGAAQAICAAAQADGAVRILLANRTPERATKLAARYEGAEFIAWDRRSEALEIADIVVNATQLGLDGRSCPLESWDGARADTVAFDTVYSPASRPFLDDARKAGLTCIDGLAMLIGQARPSFRQLFDCEVPERVDAETLLRKALADKNV
ncbi:shikimate dehydrogenase family protein [Hyphobacterium sp.]|uniref:shikimate dehydrogenase family protein n=1 Tax=Hyphobacterium sp. TaxID=2004662 RepID=UPI003BA9AAAF